MYRSTQLSCEETPSTAAGRKEKMIRGQTKTKSTMKIQKRTRVLDSYRLDEKICEKTISD
jgi:hypothetical protein